ncbi:hypothetical protein D3C75_982330 [compost metagenome]
MLTRTSSLDRGVKRQQIGLLGDFSNALCNHGNAAGILRERLDGTGHLVRGFNIFAHAFCLGVNGQPAFFDQFKRMYRTFIHFLGGACIVGYFDFNIFD